VSSWNTTTFRGQVNEGERRKSRFLKSEREPVIRCVAYIIFGDCKRWQGKSRI
jgi:hypothetical protein